MDQPSRDVKVLIEDDAHELSNARDARLRVNNIFRINTRDKWILICFFDCLVEELIDEAAREDHESSTDEERGKCTDVRMVRKEVVVREIPNPSPEHNDARTYEKCFTALLPYVESGIATTEKSKFLESIDQNRIGGLLHLSLHPFC